MTLMIALALKSIVVMAFIGLLGLIVRAVWKMPDCKLKWFLLRRM